MANTTIKSLGNSVLGGDNHVETYLAGEASMKAGMATYSNADNYVKMIDGSAGALVSGFAGVVKERYDTGMATALSNGQSLEIVDEGIVAVFIDNPAKSLGAGVGLHLSGATKGSFGLMLDSDFVALSGYREVARTIKPIDSGDTVAWAKLL